MISRITVTSMTAFAYVSLLACSGAPSTNLFGPDDTSTSGTDSSSATKDGGALFTNDASTTTQNPPTAPDGGNGFAAQDAGTSGSQTSDAGNGSQANGGSTVTAGSRVYCGFTPSDNDAIFCSGGQICCGTKTASDPNEEFACAASQSSCSGIPLGCDSTSECASGQVCCGSFDQTAGYTEVSCAATCTSAGTVTAIRMCDPNVANDCQAGSTCTQSTSLEGFYYCATN